MKLRVPRGISRFVLLIAEIISFSFSFLSGYFSNDAHEEAIAEYASEIATKHTNDGIFAITLGNIEGKATLLPVDHELYNLYGIFKQEKITFASSINSDKTEHNIVLESNLSSNLSILYVGPLGSFSYKDHFKHYVFPVESMFEDNQTKAYEVSQYICYLSKSQATRLLNKRRGNDETYNEYTIDDYKSLLYEPVSVRIDEENVFDFSVINIYLENNYYHYGLNAVMGEYIVCSYYLPMELRKQQKSMYFMSKYVYQNRYFMNYINSTYPGDNYLVSVNKYNIKGSFDETRTLSFRDLYKNEQSTSLIFLLGSIFMLSGFLFACIFLDKRSLKITSVVIPCFVYFGFKIISHSTGMSEWFSSYSCRIFFWLYLGLILAYISFMLIPRLFKLRKKDKITQGLYYEINV